MMSEVFGAWDVHCPECWVRPDQQCLGLAVGVVHEPRERAAVLAQEWGCETTTIVLDDPDPWGLR